MSYILEALKRAEQKFLRKSVSGPEGPEPPVRIVPLHARAWDVKMVSPSRFVRINVKTAPDQASSPGPFERVAPGGAGSMVRTTSQEACSDALLTTRRVGLAILALLILLGSSIAYYVWLRPAAVASNPHALKRQRNEARAEPTPLGGERHGLSIESNALGRTHEGGQAELTRVLGTLRAPRVPQRQRTPGTGQPSVSDQEASGVIPRASAPQPSPTGREATHSPKLDVVETASVKAYLIR